MGNNSVSLSTFTALKTMSTHVSSLCFPENNLKSSINHRRNLCLAEIFTKYQFLRALNLWDVKSILLFDLRRIIDILVSFYINLVNLWRPS